MNAPFVPSATEIDDLRATVAVRDLYDHTGAPVSPHIARGVYRTDTEEVIATCGPSFRPVQHRDIVDPITDFLTGMGYYIEQRDPDKRSLYDLAGKKGAFLRATFAHNTAVMRTDIITGDFIQPTGRSRYLRDGPDTMLFKVSIFNSHNGSLAVRVRTSYERLICMNGVTKPSFAANVYGKHTHGFSLKAMQAQIENALSTMHEDADRFGAWASKRITREVAETMLQRTLAKLPSKQRGDGPGYSERLVEKILDRFQHEDQTVWGLFQAVTWWQTHAETREGSNPVTTQINREARVARMLSSQEWSRLADVPA